MAISPAELFRDASDGREFRQKLIALEGEFVLHADDMIELGKEYFSRYPDSCSDRKMNEVHEGYAIARSCILEKLICGIEPCHKQTLRDMFDDISKIDASLDALKNEIGPEKLSSYYQKMDENLGMIMAEIESLPKGMIKERFIGGVTKFFNIMYLFKSKIGD